MEIPYFILYPVGWRFKHSGKKGITTSAFVDPQVVNCKNLLSNPAETFKNLYKYLTIQHYKSLILFPYNFA